MINPLVPSPTRESVTKDLAHLPPGYPHKEQRHQHETSLLHLILTPQPTGCTLAHMKKALFFPACALAGLSVLYLLNAQTSVGSDARARELIRVLRLSVLPKESGYLGLIGESAQKVMVDGKTLAVQSQVSYMLTSERPINYLHWLQPDDTHILIEGGPVDYFIFHPDGHVEKQILGTDVAAGQRPVIAVPGGCWKALRLRDSAKYALMANALSPEFTPDRVRIGAGADWIKRFSGAATWATPANLRALIGPNWQP
jgi:predicted cupin superfamily sugar epimerase